MPSVKKYTVDVDSLTKPAGPPRLNDTLGLQIMNEPHTANIDIVALHGLEGGSESTWSCGTVNWLRDQNMLQHALPHARIMSYGYDASIETYTNQANFRDQTQKFLDRLLHERDDDSKAQRPIIFIGHSLGGIVIKMALLVAFEEPSYQTIFQSTRAILFMGTPHRRSSTATLGKLFERIGSTMIAPDAEIRHTLKRGSTALQDVTYNWRNHYPGLQVASCFEMQPTYLEFERKSLQIIDRLSTTLEYPGERRIPMDADHLSICRFLSPEDANYTKIVYILKSMVTAATVRPPGSSELPDVASSPSITSISTEDTLFGSRSESSTPRQIVDPMERNVNSKLRDIAQLVEGVVWFYEQESCEISIHVPQEFSQFLLEELEKDCDLGLVLTATGTLTEAYATTVRQYLKFVWPEAGFEILELFEKARRARGYAETDSGDLNAKIYYDWDHLPPPWKAVVSGPKDKVVAFAQQLCWLSACLRSPALSCMSNVSAHEELDAIRIEIEDVQIAQNDEAEVGSASCWRHMFQNFAVATGFPIPNRGDQKGLELPLDLMLRLGRVLYPVDWCGKYALKGHSTALVPMSETADSYQWHFECNKDRNKAISLTTIQKLCSDARQETPFDLLREAPKRHFLGLWERAEIHLGTDDSNHMSITASGAEEETPSPVIVREMPIALGSSGLGFFGAQAQPKFFFPRAVKAELDAEEQLLIDRIRLSTENASIMYDSDQQCGWLVPELSLIYELILAWAARQKKVHSNILLSHLPRADVDYDGTGKTVSDLLDNRGNQIILPKSGSEREIRLVDLFILMSKAFQQRKDQVELSKDSGSRMPWSRSSTLYGWDFEDIASRRVISKRRSLSIPSTSGGWEEVAFQNTEIFIVLCKKAGLPIRARGPNRSRHCNYWTPLPPPKGYLVASIPTLATISKKIAGCDHGFRLWGDGYCCQGPNSKMFEQCRINTSGRKCNRLQTISSRPSKSPLLSDGRGMQGAILLGDGKQPERGPCCPFDGYIALEDKGETEENKSEVATALYTWVVTDVQ